MAKGNSKKGSNAATAAPPKCTCDDPFKCSCGNRPERPSKGHKWYPDEQIWGGKGHKQKGASGQIAQVSQKATITSTGKTQVAQWQRLPSQLLQEYCKGQKRPNPTFKNVHNGQEMFKFRCILKDVKDSNKDLFFVPANAVSNEEQAQEESALLALLQLTPNLPHERKLPEPYKTTWLNAIKAQKDSATKMSTSKSDAKTSAVSAKTIVETVAVNDAKTEGGAAVASTNLTLGTTFISNADKRRKIDEQRRIKNERIRKHENIRKANMNHPVFMSVAIRQQIERLLRGDTSIFDNSTDDGNDEDSNDDEEEENVIKTYVTQRLYSEGFSKRQVKNAFDNWLIQSKIPAFNEINEDGWDRIYEECLQWLLVHLNEDQLPEGFDPRGRTLDVVIPVTGKNMTSKLKQSNNEVSIEFASLYGISVDEAILIHEKALTDKKLPIETFWTIIQTVACAEKEKIENDNFATSSASVKELFDEEMETLLAIFDTSCTLDVQQNTISRINIALDVEYNLSVVVDNDAYPNEYPKYVSITGKWPAKHGAKLHVEIAKFISGLPLGEPMVFAIHGFVQELLQDTNRLVPLSLLPYLGVHGKKSLDETITRTPIEDITTSKKVELAVNVSAAKQQLRLRPREKKKSFWTTHPRDTPPAVAFPKVNLVIERTRKSLPAAKSRQEFLDAMQEAERLGSRVVLVTGETGSGKSTQLPAYLLENDPVGSKIVVVQPRRIAATGVANRVAEERGEKQAGSGSVGYVVRGDSALSAQSRLVFCTTGVLLRQFQVDQALDCLTTIVIDEVHERTLDGDILLGLLKKMLPLKLNLRVVLMSATLAAEKFKSYWGAISVPHVHIPGRTFPVVDFFLEDVLSVTGYIPSRRKKGKQSFKSEWNDIERPQENTDDKDVEDDESEQPSADRVLQSIPVQELVARVDETSPDPDLICRLLKHIISNKDPSDDGSILVFLSGTPEIRNVDEAIRRQLIDLPLTVLPLHGGLQPNEQSRVFKPAQAGFTKIVLSTNVAETSVTIPDCTVVIDTGREKQASYDPVNRMPLLVEQFASKASMKQRRGRAGRVREGSCYKLLSHNTFNSLKDHSEPEIQRVALDQILLQLIFLGVENEMGTFTNTLLDPPSKQSMEAAIFNLKKLGAIEQSFNQSQLQITPLGSHLAGIPAPPIVGKILVMGSILGCRAAALAIASGISLGKNIFLRLDVNKGKHGGDVSVEEAKNEKILMERNALSKEAGRSDHAILAYTFLKWQSITLGQRKRFCDSLGVSMNVMRDMSQLYDQLNSSLIEAGFRSTAEADRYSSSWRIIQTCVVSAMAPNQLVKVRRPAIKYHETAEGAIEMDGVAKELTFFVRGDSGKEERVFIHPSSINFSTGNYGCPFLVYNSMVRTSKPFLRDVTECNAYALLLFGGELQIQASKDIVTVDGWAELSANARIGSLIGGLRRQIDSLLAEKIVDPTLDVSSFPAMQLVIKLVRTEGLGN